MDNQEIIDKYQIRLSNGEVWKPLEFWFNKDSGCVMPPWPACEGWSLKDGLPFRINVEFKSEKELDEKNI